MSSPYEYIYGYCSVCGEYNDPTMSVCNCANKELLKAPLKSLWYTCPKCNQQYPPNSFHSCWNTSPDTPSARPADQVGGTHYSDKKIQPIEYITANNLGYHVGNIIKYITRYKDKNGLEDLKKCKWYLEDLIKTEYPSQTTTKE